MQKSLQIFDNIRSVLSNIDYFWCFKKKSITGSDQLKICNLFAMYLLQE